MKKTVFFIVIIVIVLAFGNSCSLKKAYKIKGELEKWKTVTIDFNGPMANASDNEPNPFLDYRLNVEFSAPSGNIYIVPGFYNGNGEGENSGNTWSVRFTPDETGEWTFISSFRKGKQIAVLEDETGEPVKSDGQKGTFTIQAAEDNASGFYKMGRLEYVGKHYFKFADGDYWIKGGTDSPEDFLAYDGFTNTPAATHSYSAHIQHWNPGDPDWGDGKGKGIIGVLNYLFENNVNSIFILPMNIGGDGKNVWPFLGDIIVDGDPSNDNLHYDIKKLQQWETVFSYAQKKGIFLHFVFNEAEEYNKRELDDATLGIERKLFYREMIARFSHHLALQWNICEEYNLQYPLTPEMVKSWAAYVNKVDPYKHPVAIHNAGDPKITLMPFFNNPLFQVISFQTNNVDIVRYWREKTDSAGFPQVIGMDEYTPRVEVDNADLHRRQYIWPIYLSGGQTELIIAELLETEDLSKYQKHWDYMWYARNFMERNLPFWEMESMDELLEGEAFYEFSYQRRNNVIKSRSYGRVFAKKDEIYAIYLPCAEETGKLNLTGVEGNFTQKWYNPRTGEFEGSTETINGNTWIELGNPPSSLEEDWTVLLVKN